jgi:hypothetical protein
MEPLEIEMKTEMKAKMKRQRRYAPLLLLGLGLIACRTRLLLPATASDLGTLDLPPLAFSYVPFPATYLCGTLPIADLADVTGDGLPDLIGVQPAVAGVGPDPLLCMGHRDGAFEPAGGFGPLPQSCALQYGTVRGLDIEEDGMPDAVYSILNSCTSTIELRVSSFGGGTHPRDHALVSKTATFTSATVPWDFDSADFNGDQRADLAYAGNGLAAVLTANGDGSFASQSPLGDYDWLRAGDFDADGRVDLVGAGDTADGGCALRLFRGHGDGSFDSAAAVGDRSCAPVHAADLDHDGDSDLVVTVSGPTAARPLAEVHILLAQRDGTFAAPTTLLVPSPVAAAKKGRPDSARPVDVAVADFDGDGALDLAVVAEMITVMRGDGQGGFSLLGGQAITPQTPLGRVEAGDVGGDSLPDLVVGSAVYLNQLGN